MLELQGTRNIYHSHIHAFSCKSVQKQNLRNSLKAKADAAVKGTIYSICSMPELFERNFCDGLEIKFTSPLGIGGARGGQRGHAPPKCLA